MNTIRVVRLFVDDSPASKRAQEMFDEAGIEYDLFSSGGDGIAPCAYRDSLAYPRLHLITLLVESLKRTKKKLAQENASPDIPPVNSLTEE